MLLVGRVTDGTTLAVSTYTAISRSPSQEIAEIRSLVAVLRYNLVAMLRYNPLAMLRYNLTFMY